MRNPTSSLLLETMRLVDGRIPLLPRHQARVDRSRHRLFAKSPAFKLGKVIAGLALPATGVHKVRITYGAELEGTEVAPYEVRPVNSLRVVHADDLRYDRKYADRGAINTLFAQRENCDDILIVQRNHLTDTSYANVALYDGTRWYTPAWPLLPGTRRAELIDTGVISPSVIRLKDIAHFEKIRLINSMMEWEEGPTVRSTAVLGI